MTMCAVPVMAVVATMFLLCGLVPSTTAARIPTHASPSPLPACTTCREFCDGLCSFMGPAGVYLEPAILPLAEGPPRM